MTNPQRRNPDLANLEHRLEAAFTALADTIEDTADTTADDSTAGGLPAKPADFVGTRWDNGTGGRRPLLAAAAAAGAVLIAGVTALTFGLRDPAPSPPAAEQTTPTAATTAPTKVTGPAVPYRLYTHCGIDEAKIGDAYYEAHTPLHDGAHNPPPGWDNPYQDGTMALVGDTEAVFRDDKGHEVTFKVRPGATAPKQLCR
ncbi:MAG: hypothetical protein HOY78_48790 [Saccharothrix sp.]|nr:hypothetical protein [Saccharothrix sp.]